MRCQYEKCENVATWRWVPGGDDAGKVVVLLCDTCVPYARQLSGEVKPISRFVAPIGG